MINKEFFKNVAVVADENDLTKAHVLSAFEAGLISACKKQLGVQTCRVEFYEEKSEILVYGQYFVLPEGELSFDIDKKYTFLKYDEALKMNKKAKPGELLEVKI